MLDLAFLTILVFWAACFGRRVVRALGTEPENAADSLALAVPVGLGLLALASLGLGEVGLLGRGGLVGVLVLGAWLGRHDARALLTGLRSLRLPEGTRIDRVFDGALVFTLLGTLLTALAPVTDGDALCYHLQVPKVFLGRHAVGFDPDLHETVYPLLTEMLYAAALAFRGPVACRLVQWLLGLVFAANVTALARPVLGPRARWAGTLALLVPAVSNGMSAPLNDVALAAFGNAALAAWMRWLDRPAWRTAALAGLLAGLALGVKYPALVLVGLLAAVALLMRLGIRTRGLTARQVALFAAIAVLVGGGWYLRAFVHTGNPVYPFFRQTFGGAGIDQVLDPVRKRMAVTPLNLLTALVPMTLQPARFESFAHQLGPAFLLFLPGLLVVKAPRRALMLALLGYAFLMLCMSQRQSPRFLLTAVGPMAVGVAWAASEWLRRRSVPGRVLFALLVVMLGFEASLAVARARHGLPVVLGREPAEHYLMRREPTYRVAQWVKQHLPASAHLVGQDHRGFYFPCAYTMELAHRRRTGLGTRGESAEAIVTHLRTEGFTHLLLCPPVPETAAEFDPTLGRALAPWLTGRQPLYQADITDPDGVRRRYAIYALEVHEPGIPETLASQARARR